MLPAPERDSAAETFHPEFMLQLPLLNSLRTRFIVASILVQCTVLAVLLFNTHRIWNDMVLRDARERSIELARLLNVAFAAPLAAGDIEKTADLFDGIRTPEGIDYLVLLDETGRIIATRGWDVSRPLPPVDKLEKLQDITPLIHSATPLEQAGEKLGELRFGISTSIMSQEGERLMRLNAVVLLAGIASLSLLSLGIGILVSRHLRRLIQSVERVAAGSYEELPVPASWDEISQLTQRFNEMTHLIRDRMQVIERREEKYRLVADCSHGVELWLNADGKLAWVSASVASFSGYTVNECLLLEDFPLTLVMPEERDRLAATLAEALELRSSVQDYEFRALRRDGAPFWASLAWLPLFDGHGAYLGLRLSLRDNTALKEERLALRKSVVELRQLQAIGQSSLSRAESERARLMALLSAMRFGVLFVDNDNRIVFHNPAFCDLWGIPVDLSLGGRAMGQVLQQADNRPALTDSLTGYRDELAMMEDRSDYGEITMNDGRTITRHCYRVPDLLGVGHGRMWLYEDVTQQRELAEHMISLAERDALTGLYNRHRFQQELERMMSDTDRRQTAMALLFFDLDEFKHVNDTFGHGVGDQLLQIIASEVGKQVRRHEVFARLGGDEFAILVPDCNEYEASRLAERIVQTVARISFSADSHSLHPAISVGISMFPRHAGNRQDLIARADVAMYQAKSAGKSTWRLYREESDQSRQAIARLSWKDRIVEALGNDGFELHYQGIYHTHDKSLAHLEALIRMKDTGAPGGVVMPGNFISHAETTGKIIDIDRWVLEQVVGLLGRRPDIPSIALNISGRSFDEPDLPDRISSMLAAHQVDPRRLLVELTETAAVSEIRDAQRFIDALRATGCTVCLDDFGTGFASFAYLKQLKADVLKIDGLFIRDLPTDHDSQIFVRGMVSMAREMGKVTIAEFVENEQIFRMLEEIGVDQVQGYYMDKPTREYPSLMRDT